MNNPRARFAPTTQNKMADRDAHVEELTIRDYFNKGYTYDEILALLDKYHGIRMSIATLKRRIKEYGLKRRNVEYDLASIRDKIGLNCRIPCHSKAIPLK